MAGSLIGVWICPKPSLSRFPALAKQSVKRKIKAGWLPGEP